MSEGFIIVNKGVFEKLIIGKFELEIKPKPNKDEIVKRFYRYDERGHKRYIAVADEDKNDFRIDKEIYTELDL